MWGGAPPPPPAPRAGPWGLVRNQQTPQRAGRGGGAPPPTVLRQQSVHWLAFAVVSHVEWATLGDVAGVRPQAERLEDGRVGVDQCYRVFHGFHGVPLCGLAVDVPVADAGAEE